MYAVRFEMVSTRPKESTRRQSSGSASRSADPRVCRLSMPGMQLNRAGTSSSLYACTCASRREGGHNSYSAGSLHMVFFGGCGRCPFRNERPASRRWALPPGARPIPRKAWYGIGLSHRRNRRATRTQTCQACATCMRRPCAGLPPCVLPQRCDRASCSRQHQCDKDKTERAIALHQACEWPRGGTV